MSKTKIHRATQKKIRRLEDQIETLKLDLRYRTNAYQDALGFITKLRDDMYKRRNDEIFLDQMESDLMAFVRKDDKAYIEWSQQAAALKHQQRTRDGKEEAKV